MNWRVGIFLCDRFCIKISAASDKTKKEKIATAFSLPLLLYIPCRKLQGSNYMWLEHNEMAT